MRKATLALACGVLASLVVVSSAFATHARPKAASPTTFRLVPAFNECSSGNAIHDAGGTQPTISCVPPTQTSSYLTWIAPDRTPPFNGPVNGAGHVTLKMTCLTPGTTTETGQTAPCSAPGDQMDILHTQSISDVRCVGVSGQGNCAGGAGSLYNGKVLTTSAILLTDHYNSIQSPPPSPCGSSCTGTAYGPVPFGIAAQCVNGGCNTVTSWDARLPAFISEGKRAGMEIITFDVGDAGLDGEFQGGFSNPCPPECYGNGDGEATFLRSGLFGP
jgi:hypothetical protein